MSVCISRDGEYSVHAVDTNTALCTRCWVLDEEYLAAVIVRNRVLDEASDKLLELARPHDARGFNTIGDTYAEGARVLRGMKVSP